MSNEPPNNADELLKAYARQRQVDGGDPLELHPATRRMLQGEVTRTLAGGSSRTAEEAERTVPLWRRYLFVGSTAVAVLACGIFAVKVWIAPVVDGSAQMALLDKQAFPVAERAEESARAAGSFAKAEEKMAGESEKRDSLKLAMGETTLAVVDGLATPAAAEAKATTAFNRGPLVTRGDSVSMKTASSLGDDTNAPAPQSTLTAARAGVGPTLAAYSPALDGSFVKSGVELRQGAANPGGAMDRVSSLSVSPVGVTNAIEATSGIAMLSRSAVVDDRDVDVSGFRKQMELSTQAKDVSLSLQQQAGTEQLQAMVADPATGAAQKVPTKLERQLREGDSVANEQRTGTVSGVVAAAAQPMPSSAATFAAAAPARVMSPVPAPVTAPILPPVAPVVADAPSPPGVERASAATQSWNFVEMGDRARLRRNFNSPPPVNVLNAFQFENSGTGVRIIDEDGSVYSGSISADQFGATARQSADRAAVSVKSKSVQGSPPLNFRATGTNRTLNQPVVFDGSLSVEAGGVSSNAQLRGKVRIGTRTQVEINAVPASR